MSVGLPGSCPLLSADLKKSLCYCSKHVSEVVPWLSRDLDRIERERERDREIEIDREIERARERAREREREIES